MRAVLTLAGKDLKNLLTSPLFYVISGLSAMLWSYNFMRTLVAFAEQSKMYMQASGDPSLNMQRTVFLPHVAQTNILLIFVVPALTMRLLSEEKRLRTYDLLLTSPISATQIALGKFLAAWGAVGVLTFISLLYPLATWMVADFPAGPLFAAYLGLYLVTGVYVAIGLFASSLTESVMLSVIMGLIFNIALWFIANGAQYDAGATFKAVVDYMSIGQHLLNFLLGVIKLKSLVFLLSLISLFVFLTQRVIESSRWR